MPWVGQELPAGMGSLAFQLQDPRVICMGQQEAAMCVPVPYSIISDRTSIGIGQSTERAHGRKLPWLSEIGRQMAESDA